MNKKKYICRLMLGGAMMMTLLVWGVSLSSAQEATPAQIGQKLLRGTTNLTTGWAEIPKQIYLRTKEGNPVIGPFLGLFDGIGMTFARMSAGVYEIGTFLIPLPGHYQPLLQPAYVWQKEPDEEVQGEDTF